jgi:DNA-binding NtrC family response regulator
VNNPPTRFPVSPDSSGLFVLVVSDDANLIHTVQPLLLGAGLNYQICNTVAEALARLRQGRVDVVLFDWREGGDDPYNPAERIRKVRGITSEAPVIMLATSSTAKAAASAMRPAGATDLLAQPFDSEQLRTAVTRAAETSSLKQENRRLREQLNVASAAAGFVGESAWSKQLLAMIMRVAPARSTVLIQGESGTGKELVARLLHYWSRRSEDPFIAVNCKAFADGVVESELFGHEKGSFTGAISAHAGCFERASGGTLFLDEIGEAGPDFQAKLLRVLEDGEVMRVGAAKPRQVDVRIIVATNRVLRAEVAAQRFREDLYYRLNVIPIRIPPLRNRRDDILPLARHFLALHSGVERPLTLTPEAERILLNYPWPGNVRELQNVIERAVVLSESERLGPEAFVLEEFAFSENSEERPVEQPAAPAEEPKARATENLQELLDRTAAARIREVLTEAKGNRGRAASILGVDRTTLYRLMRRLGI